MLETECANNSYLVLLLLNSFYTQSTGMYIILNYCTVKWPEVKPLKTIKHHNQSTIKSISVIEEKQKPNIKAEELYCEIIIIFQTTFFKN